MHNKIVHIWTCTWTHNILPVSAHVNGHPSVQMTFTQLRSYLFIQSLNFHIYSP